MLRPGRLLRLGRGLVVLAVMVACAALVLCRPLLTWATAHRHVKTPHARPVPVPSDTKVLSIAANSRSRATYKPNIKRDAAVMREALRRVGFGEDPGTWNRGPEVDAYLRTCGTKVGSPWCAAFVAHTIHTAYPKSKWIATASCQEVFRWAQKNHLLVDQPTAATVVLYPDDSGTYHHIGFVTAYDKASGVITVVEGNSNETGSPEGREIVEIRRYVQPGTAFVRIV